MLSPSSRVMALVQMDAEMMGVEENVSFIWEGLS
jgi:hypothetical protein